MVVKNKRQGKKDMIIDEIRNKEDSTCVQKAVQQPQQGRYPWRHNRVLQELASVISTAEGEIHPYSTSSTVFTTEGGAKNGTEGGSQ
ncbi:hypothetical protein PoB_004384900 [Plakobranchus ocellatus]|uniref:Uncharacterized protein n=1 Tax=Plakobranchus ocellatus TaxID=259542 RepID=A0AAV4BB28_9GAST|nr:hypothetical protein PoB_004384900 [Plakobranchus ocellatus]